MQVEQTAKDNNCRVRSLSHPCTFRAGGVVYCTIHAAGIVKITDGGCLVVFRLDNQTLVRLDQSQVVEIVDSKVIVEPK